MEPGASRSELLTHIEFVLSKVEQLYRALAPATFGDARTVGRKQLPTTVIGLLIHIAEHTQRHVGQAIITAKIVLSGDVQDV
jgi:hypothetical protein